MMLLFCVTVGVFLAGTYGIIYFIFDRDVKNQLDRRLLDTANPILADLIANPTEQDVFTLDLPNQYLELIDATGHVLQYSRSLQRQALNIRASDLDSSRTTFEILQDRRLGQLRVAVIPFVLGRSQMFLAIGVSTSDIEQTLANFRRLLLTMLPVSLLATALISAWYTGRSLRPIIDLTHHAALLTEKFSDPTQRDLAMPLPVANPHDELGRLATTFNELFARLTAALSQLRQFVSDASHEIRTPLAVLRGETELLLSQPRRPDEYETNLRVIDSELMKLSHIVEGLFTLSIADAGQLRLGRDRLYLDDVLEEACQLARTLAKSKSIAIERDLKHEVSYVGDEVFLRQLFLIFLDNAIKYSPPHTTVRVQMERMNGSIRVHFIDQGIGISSDHLPHIFDRFYRAGGPDTGAGEARSGGLGLAIAQAIVRAQGGTIECTTASGTGSTFAVILPSRDWGELNRN
jgi:two-component system OmpR family sensor kinase